MDTTTPAAGRMGGHEGEPAHGVSEPVPHHKVNYVAIFLLLVGLTVVTVAVAFIDIKSEIVKVLLALTIAAIKASAVALFFMHLKFEGKLIYLILFVPLALCVLLVVALIPDVIHSPAWTTQWDEVVAPQPGTPSPGAH